MQKYKWLIGVMIIALVVVAWPVQAQDGGEEKEPDQQVLTDEIVTAYENLNELYSYHIEFYQRTDQTIISGEGLLAVRIQQNIDQHIFGDVKVGREGRPDESELTINQSIETRIADTSPVSANTDLRIRQGLNRGEYEVWVTPDEEGAAPDWRNATESSSLLVGLSALDLDTIAGWNITQYVTSEAIQSVDRTSYEEVDKIPFEELGPEELETFIENFPTARNLHVYVVTFDAATMGEQFNLAELFDPDEVNVDALLNEMLENATITQRIFIADIEIPSEDQEGETLTVAIPYRVESTIEINASFSENITGAAAMRLEQTVNSATQLSAFNEEVSIVLPGYEFGS